MLKLGTILPSALLAMLPVLPLAAQEQYGGINGNGTAAFDPGWIFIYYANTGNRNSLAAEQTRADSLAKAQSEAGSTTVPVSPSTEKASLADSYTLSLRANLLRWATLTPDLGLEWRITPSVGIAVNSSWTSWSWNDADRRYALWEVTPEVRWYLGETKHGYIGAVYKAGQFNYKLSATGKQGDLMGGGITGGYQLRLNKALSLDFNVAVGCLHADYEKYEVISGVRVRRGTETKNWWGPIGAGVILVWKLF